MHTARDTGRTRADNPTIPSRRGMLAAGAAALVAGAAIATAAHGAPVAPLGGAGDDAALIALAREYHQHDVVANNDALPEAVWQAALDRRWTVFDLIEKIPARTPAGWAAKASLLPRTVDDSGDPTSPEARLALSLARDLMGATPSLAPDTRDADLIAACHDFLTADADRMALESSDFDDDAITGPVDRRWYGSLESLTAIPALTPTGMQVKAHAAYVALKATEGQEGLQREEAAALSVLADIAGRTAA